MRYYRNPDARLRDLERQAATGDWDAKLALNLALLRTGTVPPPDVEVILRWTPEAIRYFMRFEDPSGPDYPGFPKWLPDRSGVKEHWRRWYFPNGMGYSAYYRADNPLPGMSPIATLVPKAEHQMETGVFWWDPTNPNYQPAEARYPLALRMGAEVAALPPGGMPRITKMGHMAAPRILVADQVELLDLLSRAAHADPAAGEALWDGTGWDWWNEEEDD